VIGDTASHRDHLGRRTIPPVDRLARRPQQPHDVDPLEGGCFIEALDEGNSTRRRRSELRQAPVAIGVLRGQIHGLAWRPSARFDIL